MHILFTVACVLFTLHSQAQTTEPTVQKANISVHTVERGDMPLRAMAEGSIRATNPPTASVTVQQEGADAVKMGQVASISVSGKIVHGEVSSVVTSDGNVTAVISLSEPLPANTPIGTQVGALIDIGIQREVVFFARPATAKSHAEAFQFVIDPDGTSATRVRVQYGRQSGPLIEIISGLSPGDRVIVTDTSARDSSPRILIAEK
jgi:HlyD family secretion protein